MFSPLVRHELADDPLVGWTARKCVLAPLPPNIEAPAGIADSTIAAAACRRTRGGPAGDRPFRIDLSGQATQRAAQYRRDPERARAQAADRLYRLLHPRRRQGRGRFSCPRRRTRHRATTSSSAAMSPPTTRCSACSARSTRSAIRSMKASRRGAPAFSPACSPASPLIVTGPAWPDEFDHHPRFKELIDRGAVVLVARGSEDKVYADRIVTALKQPPVQSPFDFDGWWQRRRERSARAAVVFCFDAFSSREPGSTSLETLWTHAARIRPDNAGRTPRAET